MNPGTTLHPASNFFVCHHFAIFSPISSRAVRIPLLIPFAFLHIVQVYITVKRFVDFILRFQLLIAGLENRPRFPYPTPWPRNFARERDQRDMGCADERPRCFATLTF